jgi:hypothetical protein
MSLSNKLERSLELVSALKKENQELLTDGGPEYTSIANWQAYCWIHEERNYKKMTPFLENHQNLVEQKTGFDILDDRLKKTLAKKENLLQVLEHPKIPLHNNAAELAVRRMVRKRDISYQTISVKGTRTKDAFMSVIETAIKLRVNVFQYLFDRLNKNHAIQSLAHTIYPLYAPGF